MASFHRIDLNEIEKAKKEKIHNESTERCVEKVKEKDGKYNPYAVCVASKEKAGKEFLKPEHQKDKKKLKKLGNVEKSKETNFSNPAFQEYEKNKKATGAVIYKNKTNKKK